MSEPRYLLIVKVAKGLAIRDTPRPESDGGKRMRNVSVGTALYAYSIHNVGGVEYARLIPQNPQKPEWVRVAEADRSIEYVDVIGLGDGDEHGMRRALMRLGDAVEQLAERLSGKKIVS